MHITHFHSPHITILSIWAFADLRVINDDTVQPSQGFGTHPHNNMEIITFVLDGQLEHKDNMGNGSVINPYEVQHMSAGSGITHSEFNHSSENPVHLLQVWILPKEKDIEPEYNQKLFSKESRKDNLLLMVSGDGAESSFSINQDINIYSSWLNGEISYTTKKPNLYVFVHNGQLQINGKALSEGDSAAITETEILEF